MKALICKQANKLTTIGKCYPVIIKVDSTGYESTNIVLDSGLVAVVSDDNNLYCGAPTGIAHFDEIEVAKECYLAQPSLSENEARLLSYLAALELLDIAPNIAEKIKGGIITEVDESRWVGFQQAIKINNTQDGWLALALQNAESYVSKGRL